jgi:hypothetical protein
VPENSDRSATKPRRPRRTSVAPREVVLGLDRLEWGISLFAAGVALVLAIFTAIEWVRNAPITKEAKPSSTNACPSGYHLVHALKTCEEITKSVRDQWGIQFLFIVIVGTCLLITVLKRKRAGVACFAIFLGFYLGILSAGAIFFFLGAWLILRAYRLQKYGDPTFFGSNRIAKEMGQARRSGKSYSPAPSTAAESPAKPAGPPPASKRYTPKKQQRRR